MRKNYFAKKFVAYSMAFAVAFSTLTVSPVFVKEAKAATLTVTRTGTTTNVVADGVGILYKAESSGKFDGGITVDTIDSELDMDGKLINPGLSFREETRETDHADGGDVRLKFPVMTLGNDTGTATYLKSDTPGLVTTAETAVNYVLTGVENKNTVTLNAGAASTWYKLRPVEFSCTVKDRDNKDAVVTGVYYLLDQVNDTSTTYDLAEVTEEEFGTYIAVSSTSTYKLFTVVEDSKLTATVERTGDPNYTAKKDSSVTLKVNATTNKVKTGYPKYTWKLGTKVLATTTENTYKIEKLDSTTRGTYSCIVDDGVKTKTVGNIRVELSSQTNGTIAPAAGVENSIKYVSVAKALDVTTPTKLASGKVKLTSCVPTNEDYVYIWKKGANYVTMSEEDVMAHNASNNSVTITDDGEHYTANTTNVTCYVLNKSEFEQETGIINANKKLAKATTDIQKYDALKDLLTAEVSIPDIEKKALFAEEFIFVKSNDSVHSSENIVKSVGDSVSIKLPEKTAFSPVAKEKVQYTCTPATLKAGEVELGNVVTSETDLTSDYSYQELIANDFGAKRIIVVDNNGTNAAEVDDVILQEKFVNVVYQSDLEVSASDVTAKIEEEVQLSVNADSKLPVGYTWDASKMSTSSGTTIGTAGTTADGSKTNKFAVKAGDIYQPLELNADGTIKNAEDNFVLCTVYNGVERKTVKIKVLQNGGFSFIGHNTKEYKSTDAYGTENQFPVTGLPGKEVKLAPVVKPNEGTELTYNWYKTAVGGMPISTEPTYTTAYTNGDVFVCVVADKASPANKVEFKYTITDLAVGDIELSFDKIPAQKYTGKEIKPLVGVSLKKGYVGKLVEGTDYTVSYEENINVGVARATVTLSKDITGTETVSKSTTFFIDRADNELKVEDKTVVLGGSVQPKTTNKAGAAVEYTYYSDADCTTEIAVPTKVGTYYVKATSIATTNYNQAESNVAKVVVVPGKVKMLGTSRTASSVKLNWTKATGATSYRVYYKAAGAKSYKVFKNTTATSMNVTGLASATTYTFAVKAYAKTAGYSTVYATKQTTTAPAKVATPSVTAGSKKATVKFTKVVRATGYQIYMAKGNGKYVKVKTTTSTSFTKTGLAKGATYKFKVRAYKTVGSNTYYGAFSSAKAVVVK